MTYDLHRFVDAQRATYGDALDEIRRGRKTGHWMWYVFPQLVGLGSSEMSRRFGIASLGEARAYLDHPVLGPRLRECAQALLAIDGRTAESILGTIDATKLRSSMTLFHRAAPDDRSFAGVLDRYFDGAEDEATIVRLE